MNAAVVKAAVEKYELNYTPEGFAIGVLTLSIFPAGAKYPIRLRAKMLGNLADDHANVQPGTIILGSGKITQRELTNRNGQAYKLTETVFDTFHTTGGELTEHEGKPTLTDGFYRFSIAGNITRDGSKRGDAPTRFGVAIDDYNYREKKPHTIFLTARWWDAPVSPEDIHKGDFVALTGSLRVESWVDKETNERKYADVFDIETADFGKRWHYKREKPAPVVDDEFPLDEDLLF